VVVVALGLEQWPTTHWLLVIPALILFGTFCNGMAMVVARMGSVLTDTAQLLPFISRTWMYLCGVMYSLASVADKAGVPHAAKLLLYYDPPALFITVVRNCLIKAPVASSYPNPADYHAAVNALHQPAYAWLFLVFWAVAFGVGGFVYFWKAEEQYGRG
jgi:teichoic acid transport system permease protein